MLKPLFVCLVCLLALPAAKAQDGTSERPLRVLLIPADGGTSDGTLADFKPLFDGLTRMTGLHFDVKAGQSYAAVVEGMCSGVAEVAWFGPVAFKKAYERDCAEFLAVEVTDGSATYYSAIFTAEDANIETVSDMRGKSLALGSVHSASSFAYPLALLEEAGVEPLTDLSKILITGSHSNSLMALENGLVDAAGASFISFERAVNTGSVTPGRVRILEKSQPIPNPPLAVSPAVSETVRRQLKQALASIHEAEGVDPKMIRGYGGKVVDRYDTTLTADTLLQALSSIGMIDAAYKSAVLKRDSETR